MLLLADLLRINKMGSKNKNKTIIPIQPNDKKPDAKKVDVFKFGLIKLIFENLSNP